MKKFLKKLIPPILIEFIKKNSYRNKQYNSYEQAYSEIINNGYNNNKLIKNIIEKTQSLKNKNFSNLDLDDIRIFVILFYFKNFTEIRILDFGGAAGYYFHLFSNFAKSKVNWNIVENQSFVKEIIKNDLINNNQHNLEYFESIDIFRKKKLDLDLIFCSCSLQYSKDPLSELERICNLGSKYIYITRTPLINEEKNQIYLQYSDLISNGPYLGDIPSDNFEISYPITFVNKLKFENILFKKYIKIFSMNEDKKIFTFRNSEINLYGYFCRLKD